MTKLLPCPVCGGDPVKFHLRTSTINTDVIHCPKGCKPQWCKPVIHLRSVDIPAWDNVDDAWNTMSVIYDDDNRMIVSFDAYPAGKQPISPEGPFNHWPRRL